MVRTLIRGMCWCLIFGGSVALIGLLVTWTGLITSHTHMRIFETRWWYDDPSDAIKILGTAVGLLAIGSLGLWYVPRPSKRWVYPIWPDRE